MAKADGTGNFGNDKNSALHLYPKNVHENYYSNQDAEQAITIGEAILDAYPDIDLIICNDSTALPGQLQAAENKGYDEKKITITGFASPQSIKSYCEHGTIYNWGLWDCAVQGAMGCGEAKPVMVIFFSS